MRAIVFKIFFKELEQFLIKCFISTCTSNIKKLNVIIKFNGFLKFEFVLKLNENFHSNRT